MEAHSSSARSAGPEAEEDSRARRFVIQSHSSEFGWARWLEQDPALAGADGPSAASLSYLANEIALVDMPAQAAQLSLVVVGGGGVVIISGSLIAISDTTRSPIEWASSPGRRRRLR